MEICEYNAFSSAIKTQSLFIPDILLKCIVLYFVIYLFIYFIVWFDFFVIF